MYAVILTGGKQYKVKTGDKLKIEMLNVDEGKSVEFDKVLMIASGDDVKIGAPYVKDAKVLAKVVKHGRNKKIHIIKFKRRKHHMKHAGHRQYYTEVEITAIPGEKPVKKAVGTDHDLSARQPKKPAEKTAKPATTKKPSVAKKTATKKPAATKKKAAAKKPTKKK
jgi:large subunit ribosomal protein L21